MHRSLRNLFGFIGTTKTARPARRTGHRANLRLSAEFLNITNTPSFDTPGNNFTGAPNFGPPFTSIGPGTPESTFSDQGVGVVTNPIGGARQIQFTGIVSF